jgi:MICOS complex subunit MIC12
MQVVESGVFEMAKDKWNGEIEGLLKRAYETDWNAVGAKWEKRVTGFADKIRSGVKEA